MPAQTLNDFPFLLPFIVTIVSVILTFYYFKVTMKQKHQADQKADNELVEQKAREKKKEEMSTAKEVLADNKATAQDVKQEMKDYIVNVINNLRQDLAMQNNNLRHEMDLMRQMDLQTQKDLIDYIHEQAKINERIEKSLNFVSQFVWGQGAKSVPPYMEGETETQEHKDEPAEGIYKSPDSSETQEMKDDKKQEEEEEADKKEKS